MLKIIPSSRFAALMGDAEACAARLLARPRVIGAFRASLLLNLAQTNAQGRRALQACAKAAGRHCVVHADGSITQNDRVFSKASTKRLAMWAQDRNSRL
jgi:hypothetical protein